MNNDLLYIGIIAFIFLVIIGLYLSQESKLNISQKNNILMENFSPQVSSTRAQKKGAAQLYKWGLPEDNVTEKSTQDCKNNDDDIPPFTPKPIEDSCPPLEETNCYNTNKDTKCNYNCDILSHPDINKYVLKSSVPPCPDISKYATKNMLKSCPDMSKYILKSEIPKCEKIDKSKYILKTEIPACPKCPLCPVCPTCPTCPKPVPCKTINQYRIEEHPDMKNYVRKDKVKELCQLYDEEDSNNYGNSEDNCNNGGDNGNNGGDNGNNGDNNRNSEESNVNDEYNYDDNNNGNNNNNNNNDKCTYPNMLDRIFASSSNLKTNNMNGLYAGDNLFAKF